MFRTKKDVERHVSDVLSKINSENEKNLRGYTFARLFFQVKDYEAAKKHLSSFLSVRDHHAPAHKLMAQIYEVTNNAENALQSYKRSLEIDAHQTDIVLKICELYCQLSVDHDTARYWADRAEQLFPHNEIVFKLRECMVSAEGEPDHQELENLIATELVAQPKNSGLRIRLLRLYLDTERVKEAYDHAMLIESKILFPYSVEWYYLLGDIFEAYQEEFGQNLDSKFYMHYLTALDCLISLTLAEPHSLSCENGKKQYSVNDAAAVLLTFDQILKKACEKETKEESWTYFIHHMKGQLYFYMTSLLLKRAKLDQGNRKEALRFSAGLAVVCYTFKPMNLLQEIWFSHLEDNQKAFTKFFQQGSLRTSFIGHVITDICKENTSKWLQKLKLEICISQVKERIYSRIFSSVVEKDKLLSSYFILDTTFENCSLEYPSEGALQEYDTAAYKLCSNSLHHLVWLKLHRQSSALKFDDTLSEVYKGLQYSNKNLSKGSCESLCVLDLEAYLYASVYQAQCSIEKKRAFLSPRTQDSQLSYPPDIADAMCSRQQASCWRAAYGLHTSTIKEKLGESRRELQHGLEVIRGVGIHGMEVQLIVHLARMFADKADALMKEQNIFDDKKKKIKSDKVTALQLRAIHYWNVALGMLKNISSGQSPRTPKEQMFVGFNKALSNHEVKTLQDDGQLYIAVYLMDSGKLDEAAELLSKLSTPYGSYYLALTLKQLALLEENFSNTTAVLLTKAKNSLHETMDRIKDDKKHPLNKEIYLILEDIETELATNLSMNNSQSNEDLDEIDTYYASPEVNNSVYVTPNSHKSLMHSTPRPSAQFMATTSRTRLSSQTIPKHFEPSPERLDAQIRALSLNQDTIVKTLMEQQKSLIETKATFMDAMKQNTDVLEQLKKLLEDIKISDRNQARGTSRKHSYGRGQGDEEDYTDYDPNGLLEFYAEEGNEDYRNPGYNYNSSRMVHEAAAASNYVMSPAIPPGPPPPLNHYNYQYPPHAVLPAPPVAERPLFYPPPGQGLPFSEGQQLPQFQFHVATPVGKHPPPVMSNVANIPPAVTLPPPPVGLRPPQPVIPPPSAPLSMPNPWSKPGVPHAFQIPLPSPTPFSAATGIIPQSVPAMATNSAVSSHSQLKNLLRTPPSQAVLSPFGQSLQAISTPPTSLVANNLSIFAGISKTPEFSKIERARCDSENAGSPDNDGDLEREVMGDFKPLIPLPAEIVVETGEENEVVLFEDRAKLYRFVDQEWKERGIGIVKILHHVGSGRVRLLMRRDQVLKVCANHYISSNMEVNPLKSSDRAWTWVAQDFADEELRPEHFCIRFKTSELASAYKAAFDKAINISKDTESRKFTSPKLSVTDNSSSVLKPFGAKFLPKAGSWSCPTCYVSNVADKLLCVACETKKPVLQDILVGTTTSTAIPTMVTSPASVLPVVQNPIISFKATSNENKFEFSTPVSFQSSKFSSNAASVSPPGAAKNVFGGFTFSSSPMIREAEDPDIKDREILVVSTKAKNGPQVTKVNPINSSPFSGFSFVKSPPAASSLTVQLSGDSRNVTVQSEKITPFEEFPSTKPVVLTSTTNYTNMQSNTVNSAGPSENLVKLQSMLQNIKPTFVFEPKGSPKIAEVLSPNEPPTSMSTTSESPLVPSSSASANRLTDGSPEEFIPTAEFKPVVPLPALVDIKTGEEGEEKLFEERAKIFRFDVNSKEWKERGTGEMKILYLKDSHKYRILMRRDQVLKICANHYILPEMKLTPLAKGDKAWVWFAQDFSEGDLVQEQFAAKFKTADIAKKFYDVFQKCQTELKSSSSENTTLNQLLTDKCAGNSSSFDQLFKPASNAWECFNCHKSNMNTSACVYCKTPKDSNTKSISKPPGNEQKPLSELFKPDIGSWECQFCYVRNKSADSKCVSCESSNSSSTQTQKDTLVQDQIKKPNSTVSSFADLFKPHPGSWECQSCLVRNSADKIKCLSCETDKTGSSTTNSSSLFGKFQFGSSDSSTTPAFSFGKPKTGGEFVFGMRPVTQPTTFSFGHSTVSNKENETVGFKPSLPSSNVPAVFGGETQKSLSEKNSLPVSIEQTSIFGSSTPSKFNFGSSTPSQQTDSEPLGFKFGSPQKYEFNFTGVRPRSPVKTPKSPRSPAAPSDVEEEDEEDSDVDNIYFQPAIPLPPKVEVKTGEEDEKVIFCKRAKLFRFSSGEWKERGLGDIKILLDENTNRARLLMRREQVLKVCLNHYLTKEIAFESRGDKSLSWAATDFSENEPSPELLAVRFKTSELAEEFKEALADALREKNESAIPPPTTTTDNTPAKTAASTFSFKTDVPSKVETNFSPGLLSSRFGTNVQDKSTIGDSTKTGFSFTDAKESPQASSLFSFSFKNISASSTFFGQPSNFGRANTDTVLGEEFSVGAQLKETKQESDDDIKIIYEATALPHKMAEAEVLKLPKNFFLYESMESSCPGCRGCTDIIPPHKGTVVDEPVEKAVVEVLQPVVNTSQEELPSNTFDASPSFCSSKFNSLSFTELANSSGFQDITKSSPSGKPAFAGAGTPLFQNLNTSADDGSDEVPQGPDVHFEPVIPLPDLIEVKTGEEDETPVFVHRAKLFRYDPNTKQWKERGVGDIKILRHKEKLRFRVILRRDQVHNVACNHCITEDMSLSPLATSDSALCWTALDFSDGKEEPTQFAIRFKHKEQMNQFRQVFIECQTMLKDCKEDFVQENEAAGAIPSQTDPGVTVEITSTTAPTVTVPAELNHNVEGEADESNSEGGSEEEDVDILFEKRASLEIFDEAEGKFKSEGMGNLKIIYDDGVFGYHITMENDKGKTICDHIIAVQTCIRTESKMATWAAIDAASEPVTRRQFRARFSSKEALTEFNKYFEEGKEIALQSGIVEKFD